mmetsp:Transcript_8867/g.24487  ORF Transcript_8867/g.24487 Transcript_8867/m.24487 type:complete len:325 (-) Transcript_8867:298-1272(-)
MPAPSAARARAGRLWRVWLSDSGLPFSERILAQHGRRHPSRYFLSHRPQDDTFPIGEMFVDGDPADSTVRVTIRFKSTIPCEGLVDHNLRHWLGIIERAGMEGSSAEGTLKGYLFCDGMQARLRMELRDDGLVKGALLPPAWLGLNRSGGRARKRLYSIHFTGYSELIPGVEGSLSADDDVGYSSGASPVDLFLAAFPEVCFTESQIATAERARARRETKERDERRRALHLPFTFDVDYDGYGGARMVDQDLSLCSDFDSGDEERFLRLTGQGPAEKGGADWSGRPGFRCGVCGRRSENVGPRRGFDYKASVCGGCCELTDNED